MHGTAASVRPSSIDQPDFRKHVSVRYNHKPSLKTLYTYGKIEAFTYEYLYLSVHSCQSKTNTNSRDCANSFYSVCFLCMLFTKHTYIYNLF